jgi:formiminotetrahydrofolate cyclodeaminase
MDADHAFQDAARELADQLESTDTAAAGGAAAAATTSMAVALIALAADSAAGRWEGAAGARAQAWVLRERAIALTAPAVSAYADAAEALRSKAGAGGLGSKLHRAAEVPLAIAHVAADAVALGIDVAEHGDPDRRPDAVVGCLLAGRAVGACSHLVAVNLALGRGDPRRAEALELSDLAERALTAIATPPGA